MTEYTRFVFDRLLAAGNPGSEERAEIYDRCRREVSTAYDDEKAREAALARLEKVIRRQEVQALYEETLRDC